jgi:peptidoglycan/LPS O-acetylase OafA/YrhL
MKSTAIAEQTRAVYRPELDGLRALAVLAVLAYHLEPRWLPGGFLGVDVFFVLSGYVVARSQLGGSSTPAAFLARRLRRLQPALLLVVMSSGLAASLAGLLSASALQTALASLFGAGNLVLLQQSLDYFGATAALNPFTHTWSLGVEEQFYLLFPWLFPLLQSGGRFTRACGLGLLVASFASWWALLPSQPEMAFLLMPTRLWELGLGTALQLIEVRQRQYGSRWTTLAGLALLAVCMGLPLSLQQISTPLAVTASLLVIADGVRHGPVQSLLRLTPLRDIGLRSYALYLWHWPLLVILRQALPWPPNLSGALALALSLALSWGSYRWIEQPLRRGHWDPRRGLTASLTGAIALGGAWWLLPTNRNPPSDQLAERENRLRQQQCHSPRVADPLRLCLPASNDGQARILLLGDSHAGQLRPLLQKWIDQQKPSSPLLQLSDRALPNQWLGRPGCREPAYCYSNPALLAAIDRALPPRSLVVWSLYSGRLNGNERSAAATQQASSQLQQHLLRLARLLDSSNRQLLLVSDVPRLACPEGMPFAAAYNRGGIERVDALCGLKESTALQLRKPLQSAYSAVKRQARNVILVDSHQRFCSNGRCKLMDSEQKPLFWDHLSHLSGRGLLKLTPDMQAALHRWRSGDLQTNQLHAR